MGCNCPSRGGLVKEVEDPPNLALTIVVEVGAILKNLELAY